MRKSMLTAVVLFLCAALTFAAVVYVPLYRDRRLVEQVGEAMTVAERVEHAASLYIGRTRAFPPTLDALGLPQVLEEGPVSAIAITDAGIELTLRSRSDKLQGRTLVLDARLNDDGSVAWSCGVGTLDRRYQPDRCHSAFFE